MRFQFHQRESVIIALAVGGLIGLMRELIAAVIKLYAFAQTPQGLPATVVAIALLSIATLVVVLLKR